MSGVTTDSVGALLRYTEHMSLVHQVMGCSTRSVLRSPSFCAAVRFAMDRGGLVGADGATHCGAFDVTYMATLPNMIVMAPSDEAELIHMVSSLYMLFSFHLLHKLLRVISPVQSPALAPVA